MCRRLICLVSFVVLMLSLISNARAGEATDDAFVRGPTYDNDNYGSNPNVTLKNTNGNSYDRKGYIRFDVAGAVSEASLVLTVSVNNEGGGGTTPQTFTVEVYGLAESLDHTWTETDITWNNAPGNDTSSSNFTADATLLGSFIVEPLPVGNVITFSDPNLVNFINSDTDNQITILLRRLPGTSTSHNLAFAAKENTSGYSPPTLIMKVAAQASQPKPTNEATDVPRDAVLSWAPGQFAPSVNGHIVYLSDNFTDVNDGVGGITQDANSYAPFPRLDLGTTYYWRVDEVNAPPDSTVYAGNVWSFTTEPVGYPIDGSNITATASSTFGNSGPEKTIDGSGLSGDLHSTNLEDMWLSDMLGPQPTWIQYQFDKAYKLNEMWVWNQNQAIEPAIGYGFKDVTIEYSVDGIEYTTLGTTHEFADALGLPDSEHETTVDLGGVIAKYIRLTANSNWKGFVPQFGLSEVRFFHIPVSAREPSPGSGSTDVDVNATLGWRAGRDATTHDVYLSTDEQAVIDGNVPPISVTDASYSSVFDLGSTYYWRIDEVNDAETPATWQGNVWSFTTQDYIDVEDFESYNDIPAGEEGSNLVYVAWKDGFDNPNTNGSTMGYVTGASMETNNVHGGGQSVAFQYNNTTAGISEVTFNLTPSQDWTAHGIITLSLWFAGDTANVPGQLYVKINGVQVNYDGDASNLKLSPWQVWNIDLTKIGTNLSAVTSLTIGIQGSGATGTLLLDDIRLYAQARELITPIQPDDAGLVLHYAFEGNTNDSTGVNNGTAFGDPTYVQGRIGQAINLDGVDDYVAIDNLHYDSNGLTEVSVCAWVRTSNEADQIIASFDRSEYWRLEINGDGGGPGQVGWDVLTDTGIVDYGSSVRVDDDQWHHVAGVFDNGTLTIYVDGTPQASVSGGPTYGSGIVRYGYVGLGSESTAFNADPRTPANYVTGAVDDFRIYDRALTGGEVAGLAGRTNPFDKPF